ncbi:hypothetical protein BZA77DRAFT_304166 [Pyronema omphalodes]|nr:hypothetical protein BZA77DRAFT_304166 [Pyronema omphalodes]
MATATASASQAQLSHLLKSAETLSKTSPSISAHLLSRYIALAGSLNTLGDGLNGQKACYACGTLRYGGKEAKGNEVRSKGLVEGEKEKQKQKQKSRNGRTWICWTCPTCGKVTEDDVVIPVVKDSKVKGGKGVSITKKAPIVSQGSNSSVSAIGNNPAKPLQTSQVKEGGVKKKRKGNAGSLSKMLAAKKAEDLGSKGFNLFDLMKTT